MHRKETEYGNVPKDNNEERKSENYPPGQLDVLVGSLAERRCCRIDTNVILPLSINTELRNLWHL